MLTGDDLAAFGMWTGKVWECPQLLRFANGHVLVFSVWDQTTYHVLYCVGHFDGRRFLPRAVHHLDYGDDVFYAPQTLTTGDGQQVMFGWLKETDETTRRGWAGVMSVPRVLSLGTDGLLRQHPHPALEKLREVHGQTTSVALDAGHDHTLQVPSTQNGELHLELHGDDVQATVHLLGGEVAHPLVIEVAANQIRLNNMRWMPLEDTHELRIRVFVDRSTVEVFVQGKTITSRFYEPGAWSFTPRIEARAPLQVSHADMWQLTGT